jgi:hypothetical protein
MSKADLPVGVNRQGHKHYFVYVTERINVTGPVEELRASLESFPDHAVVGDPPHWGDGCYGDHVVRYWRPASEAETAKFWKLESQGAAARRAKKESDRVRRIKDAKSVLEQYGVLSMSEDE